MVQLHQNALCSAYTKPFPGLGGLNRVIESVLSIYVPIALMVLMFGMGLQLVGMDWARLLRSPKAVWVGLIGQFMLMPFIAFSLVLFLSLPVELAAGIVILAACPGGIGSNSISLLVGADIALSVTLTALSSVLALLTVPIIVGLGLVLINFETESISQANEIRLPLATTIKQLLLVMVLPLSAGMVVRRYARRFAQNSERWFRFGNLLVLLVLLLGAFAVGLDFLLDNFIVLVSVALVLNLGSLLGGFLLARIVGLASRQRLTIAIETGIQNVGVGMLIALNVLHKPDWIVVPGVYSIVMMLTSFTLIALYRFTGPTIKPGSGPA